jgi:hypothetical protein
MKINFINYEKLFLSLIIVLMVGCGGEGGKTGQPVVGISDLSSAVAINSTFSVEEGDSETQIAVVSFTASSNGMVNYETYDIDAVAKSDYLSQSGQYEMQAGQSYDLGIEILADIRVEADEKIGVLFSNDSGEQLDRLIVTILNDDYPRFAVNATDITEGDLGSQSLEFTIDLSESTVDPFLLKATTIDLIQIGSASAGSDYTSINTDVIFLAGELSKKIEVEVFGDKDIELNETIELKIEHIGKSEVVASGVIRSDDTPGNGAPIFELNGGRSLKVTENDNNTVFTMPFKIDQSGGFTEDLIVKYRLASLVDTINVAGADKAEEGQDFSAVVGQILISAAPGDIANEYLANFTISDDQLLENNEVLEMVLFNDAGVIFGSGRIYITDNESPEFKIYRKYINSNGIEETSFDLTYLEDSAFLGRHEFYVELAIQAGYDYEFEFVLRYPSAGEVDSPIDAIDIGAGSSVNQKIISRFIKVAKGNSIPIDEEDHVIGFYIEADSLVEANEVMIIEFRNSNGATLGDPIPVRILNDDLPIVRWANVDVASNTPFVADEEESINLMLQLDNDSSLIIPQVFGDKALENFDIFIERIVTPGSTSQGCGVVEQSNLSESELLITNEGSQEYIKSSSNFAVTLNFIDDAFVECDEVVDLKVTLKSQNESVNEYLTGLSGWEDRSDLITVISKNTDNAILTMTGFNVGENISGGLVSFTAELNQDIALDANFTITSGGVEIEDGNISFNSNGLALNHAPVNFDFIGLENDRTRTITVQLVDDDIVEVDEAYILTVTLDSNLPVKLNDCGDSIPATCTELNETVNTLAINGVVNSEDKTNIVIQQNYLNASESVLASNSIFTVTSSHEIANDVPDIILSLQDGCSIAGRNCISPAQESATFSVSNIGYDDFQLNNLIVHQSNSSVNTNPRSLSLPIEIESDFDVEPNETLDVDIKLVDFQIVASPANSLSNFVTSDIEQTFTVIVENDDFLTPSFIGSLSSISEGDSGSSTSGINMTWNKAIADNVPALSVDITPTCLANGCNLSINEDIVFSGTQQFFDGNAAAIKPDINASLAIGLSIVGDEIVEPSEVITLTMSLPTNNAEYFDMNTNPVFVATIVDNDKLTPSFASNTNSFTETDSGFIDTSIGLTWNKAIAVNVPALTLNILPSCASEGCTENNGVDFQFTNTPLQFFDGNAAAIKPGINASLVIGLSIVGDEIVEPSEVITLTMSLPTDNAEYFDMDTNPVFVATIIDNDKLTPSFVSSTNSFTETDSGFIDTSIGLTWNKAIAVNVPALTLNILPSCASEGCTENNGVDFQFTNTPLQFFDGNVAAIKPDINASLVIGLSIVGDEIVEPSEVITLTMSLPTDNAEYFDMDINPVFVATIIDDDKLVFTIGDTGSATPIAPSYEEGADAASLMLGYGIRWDKDIAANVPAISLLISENCDETINDLCVVTSVNSNLISGDIAGSTHIVVHDSSGATSKNVSGLSFGIEITGDNVIEPDESATLLISLNDAVSMQPFLNGASWLDETIDFSITNDDQLTISLSQVSGSVTEGGIGDLNSAGILLSWNKDIAANMDDISLTLTEQCNNSTNSHCISDVLDEDIQISNSTINLHQKNSATAAASNQDIGIAISGDHLVEPNEAVELLFSLQNSVAINSYLITPWVDQPINVTVDNDDVLVPQLSFVDDVNVAEGDEDTGNNVGLQLTWGNAVIADNTDDLIFEITDICADCGLANSDYTIDAGDISLVSKVSGGQMVLGFAITTDSMVEPNETVTINLLKKSSTPAHYFSSIPADDKFSELSYTINNDERLRVKVIRTDGLTTDSLPENQSLPLSFSWLGHAAINLPDLSIGLVEECDNVDGDNALQKCLAQTTSLNNSPADISIVPTAAIRNTGSEQDASIIAVTGTLGISQNDDDWVEISEALQLKFTIAANLQDYLRFDIAGSTEASPLFESLRSYTLVSDDILNVTFTGASSSGAITDESAEASIVYSLGVDKSVEQDVAALELEFIDASTPGQRYAMRSNSFATTADYRVFFDGLVAENIVNTSLVIKAAGQSLNPGNKSLTLTVGDDDLVEADEIVAFSLKENNALLSLFDMGIELTQNVASSERSFTILLEDQLAPAIRFSADLTSAEVISQAETDSNDSVAAIISGLSAIDTNIDTLTVNASISCKVGGLDSCTSSEASINASIDLNPATLTAASIINLGFMITGDQIIEPDEELTLTLSVTDNTEYFNLLSAAIRDFTILNDDYLSISLTDNSSPIVEGDLSDAANTIDLVIADEGAGIEGLGSIGYSISAITNIGQDNAEGNGSVIDYVFSGSPGSRTIDLTAMQAPDTATISHALATINVDHHIEADEIFEITVGITLASGYLAPASSTSFNSQYTISDDDYLTVVMRDLAAQAEDNESLKVLVCDKEGGAVESDFILDFATQTAFLDVTLDDYLPPERQAILDTDYTVSSTTLSVLQSEISNSNLYLTNHCALTDLPVDFTTDTELENDEWFGFSLSSTTSYLCADPSNNCLQSNLVIVNDEIQPVLDTGVTQCITSTGAVEAMSAEVCSELSIQDVEVEYPENKYTFIGSSGTPLLGQLPDATEVPPASYDCISDNYSGLLWSTSRLPFDGTHSTDGKSWDGSIVTNSSIFENLFSANGFCGYVVNTKKWQLPGVEELVGTIDYENLENDDVFLSGKFINEELALESIYWSKDSCDSDSDPDTKEYWAVNMKKGTVTCKPETDPYLLRAVYY